MNCPEFESIIADYLDGTLSEAERATVELHAAECPDCQAFLSDVSAAAGMLKTLEPIEPPPALVTRIAYQAPWGRVPDPFERPTLWRKITTWLQPVLQPKLVMGMAMTVLSFAMLERCSGVKVDRVQPADMNPLHIASSMEGRAVRFKDRMVKYYENLRVVYEVEARLSDLQREEDSNEKARALKKDGTKQSPANPSPGDTAPKDKK